MIALNPTRSEYEDKPLEERLDATDEEYVVVRICCFISNLSELFNLKNFFFSVNQCGMFSFFSSNSNQRLFTQMLVGCPSTNRSRRFLSKRR